MSESITARQKLESQQTENQAVAKEFAANNDEAVIYKLLGPVLLKQDKSEATMAVEARLGYIAKEIERVERQIGEARGESDRVRGEVS